MLTFMAILTTFETDYFIFRYWIDQGEKQFPRNKTVVKLKEKMNGNNDNEYNGNGNGYQSTDISPSSQNKDDDVEADNSILWSTNNMRQGNSFALNGSYRVEDYLNSTPGRGSNTPARRFPPRPSPGNTLTNHFIKFRLATNHSLFQSDWPTKFVLLKLPKRRLLQQ